jgi:ATP-binding cassette subfamily E protein 1
MKKSIAVVDKNLCKSSQCSKECIKICVVNKSGKECIDIEEIIGEDNKKKKVARVNESLCLGASCKMCTLPNKGCPFGAITIMNIPSEIGDFIVHRYDANGFRLYKMPILEPEKIMGIIGCNGVGKSSVIKLLSNKIKPNFEDFNTKLSDKDIIKKFKGNLLQKYLERLYNDKIKVSVKPQHIEQISITLKARKQLKLTLKEFIIEQSGSTIDDHIDLIKELSLDLILNSCVATLSGGELQRAAIFICMIKKADIYIFDEPSNYLDVKQRVIVAKLIRKMIQPNRYIVVIEHDLSMLDYMSDQICLMYGVPGAYGVTSIPYSTAEAINIYFDGYIPAENMRFRKEEYTLKDLNTIEENIEKNNIMAEYKSGEIKYDGFQLDIKSGKFPMGSSINLIVGKNGLGKSSFLSFLKSSLGFTMSVKPQYLTVDQFKDKKGLYPTVEDFLMNTIRASYLSELFRSDVVRPLDISKIKDRTLDELSGGELQRVWIIYCLGQDAQVYLLDEPSACLDIEQRVLITKILKRFIMHNSKIAFVIEHDCMILTSLASEVNSQIICLEQTDFKNGIRYCTANSPTSSSIGVNNFLKDLDVTFRTDPVHRRPRINKPDSQKDKEQRLNNKYYQ